MRLTFTFSISLVLLAACPDKDPSDTDTTGATGTTGASATDSEGGSTLGSTSATTATVTDGGSSTGGSAGSSTGASADDCAFLIGKTFLSDAELECGLGPDGPVPCHWSVSFTATTFDYLHSDVGESGSYVCADGIIDAMGIAGTIDAATGELVFSDVVYHPSP